MESGWEPHKEDLRSLYIVQNKTLHDVMSYMEERHGLKKTRRQYEGIFKRWGFRKNTTSDKWKIVHHKIELRRKRGKETAVYRDGRLVPLKVLRKEVRHCPVAILERSTSPSSPRTPEGFHVWTPAASEIPPILSYNLPVIHFIKTLFELNTVHQVIRPDLTGSRALGRLTDGDAASLSTLLSASPLEVPMAAGYLVPLLKQTLHVDLFAHRDSEADPLIKLLYELARLAFTDFYDGSYRGKLMQRFLTQAGTKLIQPLLEISSPANKALSRLMLATAISSNDLETAEFLMKIGRDPNMPINSQGQRPLDIAVRVGDESTHGIAGEYADGMIRLLLRYGADPNLRPGHSLDDPALDSLVRQQRPTAVRLLLSAGAHVDGCGPMTELSCFSFTPLYEAVRLNDADMTKILLDANADVHTVYDFSLKRTALHEACSRGCIGIVRELLRYGANVCAIQTDGCTPASLALEFGHLEVVRVLIDQGATMSADDELLLAATDGDVQAIETSIQRGAEVNFAPSNSHPLTALQTAVLHEHTAAVQLLIEFGADINGRAYHWYDENALSLAVEKGHKDIVQILIDHDADVNAIRARGTALQIASRLGNMDVVRHLCDHGADVNARLTFSKPTYVEPGIWGTALQDAACAQNEEIVLFLLERGADVNAPAGEFHGTALQAALSRRSSKSTQLAKILIETWGADVRACSAFFESSTALQTAARNHDVSAIRLLLRHGADVNAFNDYSSLGRTALQAAVNGWQGGDYNNSSEKDFGTQTVRLLLDAGASVNSLQPCDIHGYNDERQSPLTVRQLQLLVDAGLDVNLSGACYHTDEEANDIELQYHCLRLLQEAAFQASVSCVEFLIRNGANINAPADESHGMTALQAAAMPCSRDWDYLTVDDPRFEGEEITESLGDRVDALKMTLQDAERVRSLSVIKILLDHGAEVNAIPAETCGVTALQAAAIRGDPEIIALLLESGADVNAAAGQRHGRTALEAAAEHGNLDAAQMLLNVGARVTGTDAIELAAAKGQDGMVALLESYLT